MSCPVHKPLRPELEALPARLQRLPIDDRGYPVPWFVAWVDGRPEFRAMDAAKFIAAVKERRCWVCGDRLGVHLSFVIGPMCGINRTTSEPPSHHECAQWSARKCPFLTRPHMVRREDDFTEEMRNAPDGDVGIPILRNPGVALVWNTRGYQLTREPNGRYLITVGEPESIEWYAEGRPATRAEVEHSVTTGLPALRELAILEGSRALKELDTRRAWLVARYPAA